MSTDAEIKSIFPNYYNLIIDKLNKIYEAWDSNNPYLALDRTLKLIPFLPKKLKTQIYPEAKRIRELFQTNISGSNYTDVQLKNINSRHELSTKELEPFIDRVTSLLDESHMLTQNYGIPTRSRSMGDMQRTVDEARHGADM